MNAEMETDGLLRDARQIVREKMTWFARLDRIHSITASIKSGGDQ
jgi:hypothetical protein